MGEIYTEARYLDCGQVELVRMKRTRTVSIHELTPLGKSAIEVARGINV